MPSYFTGKTVTDRNLTASDATCFRDLVNRLFDNPLRLAVTYQEYHDLRRREEDTSLTREQRAQAKKERDQHKRVPYVVASTFPSSPWEGRNLESATDCHLLFLDVDDKDQAAKVLADSLPLAPYNHVIYRTTTSTPEHPRVRVMVEADSIPVARYAEALTTIASLLRLPIVTRESKVAVQPMYRPTVFSDQDADLEHPVTKTHFSGRAFTVADILDIELDGETQQPATVSGDQVLDYLMWFRCPLDGVSVEQAADALTHISPDCDYNAWVQVGMALRHQFPVDNKGLNLFDEWSSKGSKYPGREEIEKKWEQLHEQPKGRAPVTIRSILKQAQENGWTTAAVASSLYCQIEGWLTHEATREDIFSRAIPRIASTPLLSSVEEESLLNLTILVAKERHAIKLSMGNLRKAFKEERNRLKAAQESKSTEEKQVQPWARGIAYVASANEFVRPRTQQKFSPEAFDRFYGRFLLPTADQLLALGREITDFSLNTPLYKPSDYVLNHLKCQTADDYLYDPVNPDDTYTKHGGKIYVNTYLRDYRNSDPTHAGYAEELITDHLHNLIKEPEYVESVLDWLCFLVQHPGVKIRYALFIQGAKGCGKTFIAEIARTALGDSNVKVINQNTLGKGWSEWATGSQLVAIEEIRSKGHNRHEVMEMLKEPITNNHICINQRNTSTRTVENFTNYLIFSNWRDALAVTDDERRYQVIMSRMQKREQVLDLLAKDPDYFVRIAALLRVHPGGVRHFLENRPIRDSFNPNGPAPETPYLREMVEDTSSELVVTIKQIIEENESKAVTKDVLAPNILRNCLVTHGLDDVSHVYLSTTLREMGYSRTTERHTILGDRQYLWVRADTNPQDAINKLNKSLDDEGEAGVEL